MGLSRRQASGTESDKTQCHTDGGPLRDFVTLLKNWEKKLDYNPVCSSRTDPKRFDQPFIHNLIGFILGIGLAPNKANRIVNEWLVKSLSALK